MAMPETASAQNLVQTAETEAEQLCRLALERTPATYHSFIVLIKQRKRVGGTRQTPVFATVRLPYMTVDGRIKMAVEEHKALDKKLDIETGLIDDPVTGQKLARATVRSEIYGSAQATARLFLGGTGVDETNPVENAETSAVGRALGFLGYGCFGTGVASAEEVLRAQKLQSSNDGAAGAPARPASPVDPALSAKCSALAVQLDLRQAEFDLLRAQAPDDQALYALLQRRLTAKAIPNPEKALPKPEKTDSALPAKPPMISTNNAKPAPDPAPAASDKANPAAPPGPLAEGGQGSRGELMLHANRLGVGITAYQAYLVKKYGVGHAGDLTDAQLGEEIERFRRRYREPAIAEGFQTQCQRLLQEAPEAGA